ncbi:DNA-binding transcriptional regulator, ArsR family [Olivibacter domesticus]|uniref:DNA-binding transcriptional regulator, ArsR family n=2 Tax=Olivibacter domesticus TaxID=407022 RepID=A0A1H7HH60_OLID1|nr:DNA-binding transcriptional regulator, ArsR family [Olivibacter domesticus]
MIALYLQPYSCIMITRRDVFQAIADPTRREIIQRLAKEPLNLNAIAEDFDVSRQAVSKHIQILTECGLIIITQKGRERFCEAQLGKLTEVVDWVEQSRKHWINRFEKLDKYLNELKNNDNGTT